MYQFNFRPVFDNLDMLLYGAWLTIQLSFTAMAIGLVVSVVGAVAKTSGIRPLRWLVDAYIEMIRNTPFLVQIFFIFFALPAVGIRLVAEHGGAAGAGGQLRRLRHRDHPRRHRVHPTGQIEAGRALA